MVHHILRTDGSVHGTEEIYLPELKIAWWKCMGLLGLGLYIHADPTKPMKMETLKYFPQSTCISGPSCALALISVITGQLQKYMHIYKALVRKLQGRPWP